MKKTRLIITAFFASFCLQSQAGWIEFECHTERPEYDYVSSVISPMATGQLVDGEISKWPEEMWHQLTYCVSDKFGSQTEKVVETFATAAADWMESANVTFSQVKVGNCEQNPDEFLFKIVPVGRRHRYSMRAFFPHYTKDRLLLRVNKGKLRRPSKTIESIFRHEIGHILGFRHEHAHPDSTADREACPMEGIPTEAITDYDRDSVMHYGICGGTNGSYARLSESDRMAAGLLYPF